MSKDEFDLKPEQRARRRIDEQLTAAGWKVVKYKDVDFLSDDPQAVREFPTALGPMDYALVVDGKVVGAVEAKPEGGATFAVETQADRYADGFEQLVKTKGVPRYADRLPFFYIADGTTTLFTSRKDPVRRPRQVFHLHRPETLKDWALEEHSLRARLRQMPVLNQDGMRLIQPVAVKGLEQSLRDDRPRALIGMTMGAGKTYVAAAETYRLLRFAGAKRVLFLVDRISLGKQARDEMVAYVSPDDQRRFGDDFVIQLLSAKDPRIRGSSNVVITTIQRLYAALRGTSEQESDDEAFDESSSFELKTSGPPIEIAYQPTVPIEAFDFVWIDECHRSIYGRWGQVLDYFDAFQIGLTATPTATTIGYFHENLIADYDHDQSVKDGVNVDQQLYRIDTKVGTGGAQIGAGSWVQVRDKLTRKVDSRELDDDFGYDEKQLDYGVVNPSQIRTVIKAFKDKITTEIFPGRDVVPKTVFFCKNDQHADDVLKVIREEFSEGQDFAKKITYKVEGNVEDHIQAFRNDPHFRIAVSVDQIGTGTNVKSIECLVFMRRVGSRTLFNQMRGRAVRKIKPDDFWAVTPGAREKNQVKDHCVLIDCVALTDDDRVLNESRPMDRSPSTPLEKLLDDIRLGVATDDTLSTVAVRLIRLDNRFTDAQKDEFEQVAGTSLHSIAVRLKNAADPDVQLAAAQTASGSSEPSDEELAAARRYLLNAATVELRDSDIRDKLMELKTETEQLIDTVNLDEVISAGFVDSNAAKEAVASWRQFIDEHANEYLAIKAYYSQAFAQRPSLKDLKDLARAIAKPPLSLSPERIWQAYEAIEASRVRGHGGKATTDLVRLIRFTLEQEDELLPTRKIVEQRFQWWLEEQGGEAKFTPEQLRWLHALKNHIAASMNFDPTQDYDMTPFYEEGGKLGAFALFGDQLDAVVAELNEKLVAF
ncbi:DEAD/DEAH box helicase family protein [Patulibacter sp. SYSU D01012]|uniref:type I restriction endonuclease subunit R n=1 Tax=Patulibacter sp. SYSU D01012 TaxID=2817381 RepID=UPI001B309F1B|nr:DEAD/DEAH box helicase family protein [Patulibacter sp. SYSU D01012]